MGLPMGSNASHKLLKEIRTPAGSSNVVWLTKLLGNSSAAVRSNAAWTLALTGDPDAFTPLVQMLQDPSPEVVRWAITSLAELKDPRAVTPMLQRLARSPSPWLGSRVEDAIVRIGPRLCLPHLLDLMERPETREPATRCLLTLKGYTLEPLLERLPRTSGQTQQNILDLLLQIQEPDPVTRLKELKVVQSAQEQAYTEAAIKTLEEACQSWRAGQLEQAHAHERESRFDHAAAIYRDLGLENDLDRVIEQAEQAPMRDPHLSVTSESGSRAGRSEQPVITEQPERRT